ncbi:MAG: helix-hairpin-helix domain-containing protein [Ginsengibacter sp.]
MWRDFIKDYFTFTAKERKGNLIIVTIIILILLSPLAFSLFTKRISYNNDKFEKEIGQLKVLQNDSAQRKNFSSNYDKEFANDYSSLPGKPSNAAHAEVFYFDPNTATPDEWKRLGIREKTINTIKNYLSKGGKFYKPEDIGKIWGIASADVQRLIPYVRINLPKRENVVFEKKEFPKSSMYPSSKPLKAIDINLSDTTEYISLPGIGSKLAQRIVAFREKLGGFYSVEQIAETYMLPDSTFQKIKPLLSQGSTPVKKFNINTASVDEMKIHPYIRYNLANAIFQYRQQHGNFVAVDGVKKIMIISDEIFLKISPYLSVE